jgi:hypothetical protein
MTMILHPSIHRQPLFEHEKFHKNQHVEYNNKKHGIYGMKFGYL